LPVELSGDHVSSELTSGHYPNHVKDLQDEDDEVAGTSQVRSYIFITEVVLVDIVDIKYLIISRLL
jgi:hypothetical protein